VPRPIDPERLRRSDRTDPLGAFHYDTPAGMADRIRAHIGAAPVETVYLWASVGGMAEDAVVANVRTLCTKLAPLLRPAAPAVA
jgi:hypothetical protein